MAYYDSIAKRWHEATGYKGGAFKELVLNNILLEKVPGIADRFILELGAGNGYFLPLVLRRFSGQVPSGITITDKSARLLEIAQRYFRISNARYQCLDVCKSLPFASDSFDLIIASMVFNEVPSYCFKNALKECHRVLKSDSLFLISVIHPDFITSLQERNLIAPARDGMLTMPGSGSLRLPVVMRSLENYRASLREAGFQYEESDATSSKEVLNLKGGLRNVAKVPIALIYTCAKIKK